jgi:hypothetical protein
MELRDLGPDGQSALERVLGYLNFSSGTEDVQFLSQLNFLYEMLEAGGTHAEGDGGAEQGTGYRLLRLLTAKLTELEGHSPAFQDASQVRRALVLLRDEILPGYQTFHRDLLFHHTAQTLYRPFLVGRICEVTLQHGDVWDDPNELRVRVIRTLNDYVGYRPVAVLESRVHEPYAHERVRPIPIYVRGAGAGSGPYRLVVDRALEMLGQTEARILRAACFDPDHLQELAIDPRAYDFDHPVNKRPNYHFGQWDPHAIDNRGYYYRFVIQQVTLDSLMARIHSRSDLPHDELQTEAAAVLAGTILMASGVSGFGPDTFDSETTLGNLLPGIAAYRDAFYEQLIRQLGQRAPKHAQRLTDESRLLRQPFGSARQHLNSQLTRRRASQLEHVRLASIFARMGHPEAAQSQINAVPVASARMLCQIDCNLTRAQRLIDLGQLREAHEQLTASRLILNRAIECGAMVDPWNILGFDGNFSLFPAMENSIHDHRVDELVDLLDEIFDTYGRLWSMAAATNDNHVSHAASLEMEELAKWWHQYAAHEVSSIDGSDPLDLYRASHNVAEALRHWHAAGEERGAIKFWAPYVEQFDSPKAYAMVINMLLDRDDLVAARGLLIHWLGQADTVMLEQGEDSFYRSAARWLVSVLKLSVADETHAAPSVSTGALATPDEWQRVRKFFDYLEANAGVMWQVPKFGSLDGFQGAEALQNPGLDPDLPHDMGEEGDEEEDLFGAAYEDVVYRDSTDDGMEGAIHDGGGAQEDALDETHDQIVSRLSFLNSLSRQRRIVAIAWMLSASRSDRPHFADTLRHWLKHTWQIGSELEMLVMDVWRHRLTKPTHDYLSLAEFDRERTIKESLMEHVIGACVEAAQCAHFLVCALRDSVPQEGHVTDEKLDEINQQLGIDGNLAIELVGNALRGRREEAREAWRDLKVALRSEAVLYVPLVRGGNPQSIIRVRIRQQVLRTLLCWMPRLGLLTETRELIDVIRQMERNVPAGPGAVTEFDDLFEEGFRALVQSVIRATNVDESQDLAPSSEHGPQLVSCLEAMTESMLVTWLSHSRTLRLSVLEKVKSTGAWQETVDFIKNFGADLFTQQFLSLANIRSILYQGVDQWLEQMQQQPPPGFEPLLIDSIDRQVSREDAVRHLNLILEAIVENYTEYRDYNSTTTQSDRGDLLYNFLDFLRLLSNYERVVWNLKPVVIAHELLVRHGCNDAALMWRRALSDRIAEEADRYMERLKKLQQRYAMQLPTIADRIGERFLRPLVIDRMRALVAPSIEQPEGTAFNILESEALLLTKEPSGVGFEPPAWLLALEEEVRRWRRHENSVDEQRLLYGILPAVDLTIEQVQHQIKDWETMRGK